MDKEALVLKAQEEFGALMRAELERIEKIKEEEGVKDYSKLECIKIGIMPGDGIGPYIMEQALRVVRDMLSEQIAAGKVEIRIIEGMTIEDRVAKNQSLPDDVLAACKECDVLVKGPFVTPHAGDGLPNFLSANSLLRRGLQLFAAVRPIRIPEKNMDITFFRENIEGEYILGNKGISVGEDLAVDFKVLSKPGAERIARAAFEFARKNGKKNVTVVTKANIVKLVDGNFVQTVHRIGETEYPEIEVRDELVDSTAAKLSDPEFTKGIDVIVLPNLYGDIVTDVAAELQGGLGTASSSNLGNQNAMFEAIHGVGVYLCKNNLQAYADPCSLIRAMGEMMAHIGFGEKKALLSEALDICTRTERKVVVDTYARTATNVEFTDYLLDTIHALQAK